MNSSTPRLILTLGGFLLALVSCAQPANRTIDLPFEGQLLFVEDLSGSDGLNAGRFGDLVILDGTNNERREVTRERYYYASPQFIDGGRRILFESKRPNRHGGSIQLNTDSRLYALDLQTAEEQLFEEYLGEGLAGFFGLRNERPGVSPTGSQLVYRAFAIEGDWKNEGVVVLDLVNKQGSKLNVGELAELGSIDNFSWSRDEALIAFQYRPHGAFLTRGVAVFSVEENRLIWYVEDVHARGSQTRCNAGGWTDNRRFVFTCLWARDSPSLISTVDVDTGVTEVLAEVPMAVVRNPHFSRNQEKILFIGSDGSLNMDIWMYDMSSDSLIRITDDGRRRGWLTWRE